MGPRALNVHRRFSAQEGASVGGRGSTLSSPRGAETPLSCRRRCTFEKEKVLPLHRLKVLEKVGVGVTRLGSTRESPLWRESQVRSHGENVAFT